MGCRFLIKNSLVLRGTFLSKFSLFPILLVLVALSSCDKGSANSNLAPNTHMAYEAINLSGDLRLNSKVTLSWYGTDKDGYVSGYEISFDGNTWFKTATQDSTFIFGLQAGQDTADIDFFVRSIDEKNVVDPTPAYLKIPLKNTPPQASFTADRCSKDTAFVASTFFWSSSDPDGDETIKQAFIKINTGDWVEVNKNQSLVSFLVDSAVANGNAQSEIYYATNTDPEANMVNGMLVDGLNQVFLKVIDIAGAESMVDSSNVFYLKNKNPLSTTLWISGHVASVAQQYKGFLDAAQVSYDFLNYGADQGARQPVYWNPTVSLVLNRYDNVFINAPNTQFPNVATGGTATLLNYLAPLIQDFSKAGKPSFISTALAKNEDFEGIAGPFPIEGVTQSKGQVRIYPDSSIYAIDNTLPNLKANSIISGVTTLLPSNDAELYYRGSITPLQGWAGDNVLATARRKDGKLTQVFFGIELHNYSSNPNSVENLIAHIFDNEFK